MRLHQLDRGSWKQPVSLSTASLLKRPKCPNPTPFPCLLYMRYLQIRPRLAIRASKSIDYKPFKGPNVRITSRTQLINDHGIAKKVSLVEVSNFPIQQPTTTQSISIFFQIIITSTNYYITRRLAILLMHVQDKRSGPYHPTIYHRQNLQKSFTFL
jgi:hypothetical protein